MSSTNKLLLIPFLAFLFNFNATGVLAAEDDSDAQPDDKTYYFCKRDKETKILECWCNRGDGSCADMSEICLDMDMDCESDHRGRCECTADEDKFRETGSRFDELKSKIEPQSPVVENAPTEPVIHDHRSPKIDSNNNNQAEIVAPNNRTGTVRVQRTRPSSSSTVNTTTPIVTDHR